MRVVTLTSSPSIQNFTHCRHKYNDLTMRVLSLPSLSSAYTRHHFQINIYSFCLSFSLLFSFYYVKCLSIHDNLKNPSIFFKIWSINHIHMQNIGVEDGFATFGRFSEVVHQSIVYRFARIGLQYAGGLRESSNYDLDSHQQPQAGGQHHHMLVRSEVQSTWPLK